MLTKFLRAAAGQAPSAATDPNFNQTVLLLHGDGTNGGQNNTFIDGSSNNFTITRNGNTTQGSVNPYGNLWSNYFDGVNDYLGVPTNSAFAFGTGDFTIEYWVYTNKSAQYTVIDLRGASGVNGFTDFTVNGFPAVFSESGSFTVLTSSIAITYNAWNHVAYVRSGTSFTIYVNGVSGGSVTNSSNWAAPSAAGGRIGANKDANNDMDGYISNLRVVKGTAVYTSAFTPPTAPLTSITNTSLLTCQSSRLIDNSSNNFTITPSGNVSVSSFAPFAPTTEYSASTNGGSGYFDGNADFLQTPTNTALAANSTSYTAEAWVYLDLGAYSVFDYGRSIVTDFLANANGRWFLWINNSGFLSFSEQNALGGSDVTVADTVVFPLRTWTHVMAVKSGTTMYLFKNGVLINTATSASRTTFQGRLNVGQLTGETGFRGYFLGYISSVRFLNGTALYTSSFTPPTAPLTAITNTQLLLNFTNAAIFDNTTKNNLETIGNVQIDTTVKKYGTGSIEFDGSGDYLIIPSNNDLTLGSGDFTIEFWTYLNGQANYAFYDQRTSLNQVLPAIYYASSGSIRYYVSGADRIIGASLTTGVWSHIALARSGTATKMFINGTQTGSTYTDTNNYIQSRAVIGAVGDNLTAYNLNGYIDDLRITKGVARYTANFTPPTQAFPNI